MTTPEARRLDLYNGLTDFLGEDRASTLMTYLPQNESKDLATKTDLGELEGRIGVRIDALDERLGSRIDALDERLFGRIDAMSGRLDDVVIRLDGMTERLDRMVLSLVVGLVAIIATLIAQSFI